MNLKSFTSFQHFFQSTTPDDEDFQIFLKTIFNKSVENIHSKVYSDCSYDNYPTEGISICWDKNKKLSTIHVYNVENLLYDNFNSYKGINLPYDLNTKSTLKSIVQRFAPIEPQKGGGLGSGVPLWIRYNTKGIMFEFDPKLSWNNNGQHIWREIILFKPEIN